MTAEQADIEILTDPVQYRCRRCGRHFSDLTVAASHASSHVELEGVLAEALDSWQWKLVLEFSEELVQRLRHLYREASKEEPLMNPDELELLRSYQKGVQDTANLLKDLLHERKI